MNPYQTLDANAFWAKAVAAKNALDISELWNPKWKIQPSEKISTFGSCFAQHIGNALQTNNYHWFDGEPAPHKLTTGACRTFNYGIFSARTGNIYTTSLLRQWTEWALGHCQPPSEIWVREGRAFDPFRPVIEPNGFANAEELNNSRKAAIKGFERCIKESRYFVFTLGLTESWFSKSGGHEYPLCPGTAAGTFVDNEHEFHNQNSTEVRDNLLTAMKLMREVNPTLRFLLTVSPVPLTATMSKKHVLVATTYSKSVLRAVAGELAQLHDHIDYFPSFEIISTPPYRGMFYEPNQRGVVPAGVGHVMKQFFDCLYGKYPDLMRLQAGAIAPEITTAANQAAVCEEELLGAFSSRAVPS